MHLTKPLVVIAAAVVAAATTLRRRRAQADADEVWREATSDASR